MQTGSRQPRAATNGDEYDVTTGWRKLVCRYQRTGVVARIKRAMRRRERHAANEEATRADRAGESD